MKSIKIKLFLQFIFYLLSFICLFVILNSLLVKKYFIYHERKEIHSFVREFDKTYKGLDSLDRNGLNEHKLITGRSVFLISKDYEHIFDTKFFMSDEEELKKKNEMVVEVARRKGIVGEDIIKKHLQHEDIIKANIEKIKTKGFRFQNKTLNGDMMSFWLYQLSSGEYIGVTINEPLINEATLFINNFLIMISLIIAIITGGLLYKFSEKLTEPIINLMNIAMKISNLDFDEKFPDNREDEIGVLGRNMNFMSNELKSTLDKLKHELERKEEIDQIRKNFISSVSHELKTPVGLIRGCSEVLKYNILKDPEKKKEYYNNILQETERMDLLVKDMLHISYMESGSFLINKSEFYMDELIEEIYSKYNRKFNEKEVIVEKIVVDKVKVEGDKVRIFQVIVNFLENALRHLDTKKYIQIKMEEINSQIKVSIFNSGNNIPENEIENIWLSFYKTDKAHSRKSGNSGLGLAIVKSIIDSHKGEYGVENEEGGVRFYFLI